MKDRRTHKLRNGEAGTTLEQDGSSEYLSQTGQVSHYRPGTIAYAATPPLITIIHTVTGGWPILAIFWLVWGVDAVPRYGFYCQDSRILGDL